MNAKWISIVGMTCCTIPSLAQECANGTCPLPASGEATISVVSPVPETAVKPMAAAPRLESLDGKTIALVGKMPQAAGAGQAGN